MRQNTALLSREPICSTELCEYTQDTSISETGAVPLVEIDVAMRETVILSLQPQLRAMAQRFARQMRLEESAVDGPDLIQEANVVLLEVYAEALRKPNPYAYLIGAARLAMIKSASSHARTNGIRVLSLDAPLTGESGRTTSLADMLPSTLHQPETLPSTQSQSLSQQLQVSLARLTEAQRLVILHHFYGVDGPPESLAAISRRFAWSINNAQHHKQRAIAKLRKYLTRASVKAHSAP